MLLQLSKNELADHYHFLNASPTNIGGMGYFVSSAAEGHTHTVTPDGVNGMIVGIAGEEPHTHTIERLNKDSFKQKEEKEDDDVKVRKVKSLYREAATLEAESREKGEESERFVNNDQWTQEDRRALEAENRVCLTINEISQKIDLLCGIQRQNRSDITYYPVEDGDNGVAKILTELSKNVQTKCNYEQEENETFKDQVTVGRGIMHIYADYLTNVQGEIKIENVDWRDIYFGPHEKLDASDVEYIIRKKKVSIAKLEAIYPDKEEDLESAFEMAQKYDDIQFTTTDNITDQYASGKIVNDVMYEKLCDIDVAKKNITLYELYVKDYLASFGVIDISSEYVEYFDNIKSKDRKALQSIGFKIVERTKERVRVIRVAGSIFLEEEELEIPQFPFVVAYGKKTRNGFFGKVEEVKDTQREINRRHSQAMDILNRVAVYGWITDGQTFDDERDENFFKNNSARSGFIAKVKDVMRPPQLLQGVKFPTELINAQELSSQKLSQIMNISPETLGFQQREVSSAALVENRRNVLVSQEFLYDNLNIAKKQLGKLLIQFIKQVYSAERIARLVINKKIVLPQDEQLAQLQMNDIVKVLETADLEAYDVNVALSPNAPSTRASNMALLLEMARQGIQIDPKFLISSSDLANKEQLLGSLEQAAAQAAKEAQDKANSEIEKSRISAVGKIEAAKIKAGNVESQVQQPQI